MSLLEKNLSGKESTLKKLNEIQNVVVKKARELEAEDQKIEKQMSKKFRPLLEPVQNIYEISKKSYDLDNDSVKRKKSIKNETPYKEEENIGSTSSTLKNDDSTAKKNSKRKKKKYKPIDFFNNTFNEQNETFIFNDGINSSSSKEEENGNKSSAVQADEIDYYLNLCKNRSKLIDQTYGVQYDRKTSKFLIGNDKLSFNNQYISLGDEEIKFPTKPGILQLLFLKNPDNYTDEDLKQYGEILEKSSVHRRNFQPDGLIRGGTSEKYKNIVSKIVESLGGHVPLIKYTKNKREFVYWNTVDELVNRLRILIGLRRVGHNNVDNEIYSIIEELKEEGVVV